jgi:DNA-binding CsgD family transcriptional regulator
MSQSHNQPRAVVHRNILDVAEAEPEASIKAIAQRVSGATVPLVERVLENYGDPADATANDDDATEAETDDAEASWGDDTNAPTNPDVAAESDATSVEESVDTDTTTPNANDAPVEVPKDGENVIEGTHSESDADVQPAADGTQVETIEPDDSPPRTPAATVDRADLSEAQRETLQIIADRPEASQRDIAAVLGLSQSTVNNRLNSIEGFEWSERTEFAAALVEADGGVDSATTTYQESSSTEDHAAVLARLDGLERQLDSLAERGPEPLDDPDLVRSVLQACFESDAVSTDQERQVVASLMGTTQHTE